MHKLSSPKTHLPYDYYSLPFCEPAEGKIRVAENLGEVLHGAVIQNSPYEILMGKSEFKVRHTELWLGRVRPRARARARARTRAGAREILMGKSESKVLAPLMLLEA